MIVTNWTLTRGASKHLSICTNETWEDIYPLDQLKKNINLKLKKKNCQTSCNGEQKRLLGMQMSICYYWLGWIFDDT